jgi:hypothetical protein
VSLSFNEEGFLIKIVIQKRVEVDSALSVVVDERGLDSPFEFSHQVLDASVEVVDSKDEQHEDADAHKYSTVENGVVVGVDGFVEAGLCRDAVSEGVVAAGRGRPGVGVVGIAEGLAAGGVGCVFNIGILLNHQILRRNDAIVDEIGSKSNEDDPYDCACFLFAPFIHNFIGL